MELTAEQKYLKALAEWLDIETIPKNRIQEASREYLDQFREVKEKVDQFTDVGKKVETGWTPEVGKLYRRDCGTVYEYMGIKDKYALFYALDGSKSKVYSPANIPLVPIAELEGLKVGDTIWFTPEHAWIIIEVQNNGYRVNNDYYQGRYSKSRGGQYLCIDLGGYCTTIGIRAFRTADRAERFGRLL